MPGTHLEVDEVLPEHPQELVEADLARVVLVKLVEAGFNGGAVNCAVAVAQQLAQLSRGHQACPAMDRAQSHTGV